MEHNFQQREVRIEHRTSKVIVDNDCYLEVTTNVLSVGNAFIKGMRSSTAWNDKEKFDISSKVFLTESQQCNITTNIY